MDINTYQDNEDAFALLSILRMAEKDIENGNVKDSKEVFEVLRKNLKKMTRSAENDLNGIVEYIYQNSTALIIMEKIIAKINTLDHFPNRGGYVPELLARNVKEYRQITEEPWKILL